MLVLNNRRAHFILRNKRIFIELNIQLPLCILKLHDVSSLVPRNYLVHDNLMLWQTRLLCKIMHWSLARFHLLSVHLCLNNDCGEDSSFQKHKRLVESTFHDSLFNYILEFLFFWEVYGRAKGILIAFLLLLFVDLVLLRQKHYVMHALVFLFLPFIVDALYYFNYRFCQLWGKDEAF